MTKALMIDMETMAVSPNATVLSLGAVHFNPYGNGYGDKLYFRISIDDQDALGREVDPNTIEWWSQVIEVPCITEGALTLELVRQYAPVTDFFAIGPEIWGAEDATAALKDLLKGL
jgi:hypothetical protein